jgi:hypothetical protein
MGLFKKAKDQMAQAQDAMSQAQDAMGQSAGAQQMADDAMRQAGMGDMGGVNMGNAAQVAQQGIADRGALEQQAHEQNRILGIGSPGVATIKGHVDTGEQVAGNPVWMLEVEIAPEGGAPYTVQKREIISSVAMSGYADGTTMPCRIDPADPNTFAFGEKPFM